ncbi:hypothetical protein, partial [Bacillus thuringiensis]|uniref:hypothetical protein n=1 Tax=Bacillus thuringiensis TaxID=1428 RepID=UPI001C92EFB6
HVYPKHEIYNHTLHKNFLLYLPNSSNLTNTFPSLNPNTPFTNPPPNNPSTSINTPFNINTKIIYQIIIFINTPSIINTKITH